MRSFVLVPLLVAVALPAQVRPAASRAQITGVVFDSLVGRPLGGATVIASGAPVEAITDSLGRYRMDVDSVGEGPHTFSFFHPTLDSIGIAPPPRTIVLHAGVSVVLDLAMPSAATLVASVCPESLTTGGRGLIIGEVRDADLDKPLAGAFVVVRWSELTVGASTLAKLPKALSVKTDQNGLFRLCGVPARTELKAQARQLPKMSGFIDIVLAEHGVVVQEFLVGDRPVPPPPHVAELAPGAAVLVAVGAAPGAAPAPVGTSSLVGTVVGGDGAPLQGAQVMLLGTNLSVKADYKGAFRLGGLPAGTQTVEVRLLSYQPRSYIVNLAPRKEAHLSAILDTRAQVLDPVTVIARQTSDIPGYDDRKAHALGTFFNHDQIMEHSTNAVTDVLRSTPGMQVMFLSNQYVVVSRRAVSQPGCTTAQWWVDGVRYDAQASNMDDEIKPIDIEAMEVYSGATDTPVQFQGGQAACGTIVVWTMRGHFKPKKTTTTTTTAPPGN